MSSANELIAAMGEVAPVPPMFKNLFVMSSSSGSEVGMGTVLTAVLGRLDLGHLTPVRRDTNGCLEWCWESENNTLVLQALRNRLGDTHGHVRYETDFVELLSDAEKYYRDAEKQVKYRQCVWAFVTNTFGHGWWSVVTTFCGEPLPPDLQRANKVLSVAEQTVMGVLQLGDPNNEMFIERACKQVENNVEEILVAVYLWYVCRIFVEMKCVKIQDLDSFVESFVRDQEKCRSVVIHFHSSSISSDVFNRCTMALLKHGVKSSVGPVICLLLLSCWRPPKWGMRDKLADCWHDLWEKLRNLERHSND